MIKKTNIDTKLVILIILSSLLVGKVNANALKNSSINYDLNKDDNIINKEQYKSLNNDLQNIGKKYNLSKDTVNDLISDVSNSDSDENVNLQENSDIAKSETNFIENNRIQSIPLKDIAQLGMINNNHKNTVPYSIMTIRIDAYRLTGNKDNIDNKINMLKTVSSLKEFKDDISSFNNVDTIAEKKYFPVVLNRQGYVIEPSAFEMINSRSFFNEDIKKLENKPYGYAFYINSPKDSFIKTLLGIYDNPCNFIENSNPICYQNYIVEDISDKKDGVISSEYNNTSNTQIVVHYQKNQKIIP